jgi:hypothetical protein
MIPGCTNDYIAYNLSAMRRLVDNMPDGYYILGDPAYPLSDHLLISYTGTSSATSGLDGGRDDYNFHHSQLRYVGFFCGCIFLTTPESSNQPTPV